MRIKQQAQKKISSGHGEEGALWMNRLHNEESREALAVWVEGGDKVAKQVVQSTPSTTYIVPWVVQGVCQANFALQAEFRT